MKTLINVLIVFVLIANTVHSQEHGLINNSQSPYMQLKSIDLDDCRWTKGFWAEKLKTCHDAMIPNLGRLMSDPEIIHAYENFKVAAGLKEGEFRGWSFHDGDFYKYVEAIAYQYNVTKDPELDELMDEIIGVIGKAQLENGYIHTQKQIGHGIKGFHHSSENDFRLNDEQQKPWTSGGGHELYNMGHLMTAACVHYRITGKKIFLDIAIKASDNIYDHFKIPSPELARVDWNPPHYMGLVEMYRTTGEKKYLELAETFINMLGTAKKEPGEHRGLDHSQRRTPIREVKEAVGHAGHGNYLYSGVADLYAETGEKALLDALERIWTNVTTCKMYVTGATGTHHYGISNKAMVSESYGMEYELPNIKAYTETCANIGNAMWNWRMFLITGETRFMDLVELIYYNSAISGIALDGTHFSYTNPLRFIEGHPQNTKDGGKRSEFMSVFCCPPNIVRTIAKMHSYAYNTSDDAIWVNLYGSNILNTELTGGEKISLEQDTNYPWDGDISIIVKNTEATQFSLKLRIPSWTDKATVEVNGKTIKQVSAPGTYFEINRKWKAGDKVRLKLLMEPQMIVSNPDVEEILNQVAVKRGPLVYCLESIDLPKGHDLQNIVIPQDVNWIAFHKEELLGGVTVLEGKIEVIQSRDWENQLYLKLKRQKPKEVNIQLIPYYAWANRGISDMTVWMELDR